VPEDTRSQPFGRRPQEKVYGPGRSRRPEVRTRAASFGERALSFEPEADQSEALAEALSPPPPEPPRLEFEPEEGEMPAASPAGGPAAPPAAEAAVEGLVELAAGRRKEASEASPAAASPLGGEVDAPAPDRGGHAPRARAEGPPARERARRNWISVFLSERVLGRRGRRKSTLFLRRSAAFRAVAGSGLGRTYRRARRRLVELDSATRGYGLPLANIFWTGALALLAGGLGAGAAWAGVAFASGLLVTALGQPARNLVGFAGIIIAAAALTEILRQRERFFEIMMDLFG
jgi:hypothetical protein